MNSDDLKRRTKKFSLDILDLVTEMPKTIKGRIIAMQLGRCATSVGANYRAACRSRSKPEFIAKVGTVIEESDESAFWMELTIESRTLPEPRVAVLLKEADELTAIMTSSRKTAQASLNRKSEIGNQQ